MGEVQSTRIPEDEGSPFHQPWSDIRTACNSLHHSLRVQTSHEPRLDSLHGADGRAVHHRRSGESHLLKPKSLLDLTILKVINSHKVLNGIGINLVMKYIFCCNMIETQ